MRQTEESYAPTSEPSHASPATEGAPVKAPPLLLTWLMGVMVVLLTVALYWPATRCDFLNLDDPINVTGNVHIRSGLTVDGVKWAFFNYVDTHGWQPLTRLSHMAVCQVYGLNPLGHHLANVLLHGFNAGLVFALLRTLTGATWRSLLVAALFAVHPLRVEAVAWVTERRALLSTLFGLLSLIAYARYSEKTKARGQRSEVRSQRPLSHLPPAICYLLSLFFFALGLMSGPIIVTWPFVMLLLDYWPLGRIQDVECRMRNAEASDTRDATRNPQPASRFTFPVPRSVVFPLLVEKIPFFVMTLLIIAAAVVCQFKGILPRSEVPPLSARAGNALVSYGRYLGKLFWPTDLAIYYPHPGHWPPGKVLLAGVMLLGVSVLAWVWRRRLPGLLVGWLWFCGTLVPMSQIFQTSSQAMADRWTYIPCLGLLFFIVWGVGELTQSWRYRLVALSAAAVTAIVSCLALTRQQIGFWKDSEAVYRHAAAVTENNYPVHDDLANILYDKGQVDEAISHFEEFVRLKPDLANSHYNLGVALFRKGRIDEAIRQLQEAIRLDPGSADAHYNLGVAFYQQGRAGEAIRQFQETVRLDPGHAEAHNNLGAALGMQGQTDEAIRHVQEALRLKPGYADARRNLNVLLAIRPRSSPMSGAATNR
jgi:protein O-mannosyl-transferase